MNLVNFGHNNINEFGHVLLWSFWTNRRTELVFKTAGWRSSPQSHSQRIGTYWICCVCSRWTYVNIFQSNSCARNCFAARKIHSHIRRWRSVDVSKSDILYLYCRRLHTTSSQTLLLISNFKTNMSKRYHDNRFVWKLLCYILFVISMNLTWRKIISETWLLIPNFKTNIQNLFIIGVVVTNDAENN